MPYRVAAFADGISTDIQIQMDLLLDSGIKLCALQSAFDKHVLDWQAFHIPLTKTQFLNRGIKFSCLASALGKRSVTEDFAPEIERFRFACQRAQELETKVIRVYSCELPTGADHATHKGEVIRRVKAMAEAGKAAGLNLLLENAASTYGSTADRCVELFHEVNAPNLMASFDFGSFVEAGEDPRQAWAKLKKWVRDFHVKDRTAAGQNVVAGQGEGKIPEILGDALSHQWAGLLTLKPELKEAEGYKGLDGKARFRVAVKALKDVLGGIKAG